MNSHRVCTKIVSFQDLLSAKPHGSVLLRMLCIDTGAIAKRTFHSEFFVAPLGGGAKISLLNGLDGIKATRGDLQHCTRHISYVLNKAVSLLK